MDVHGPAGADRLRGFYRDRRAGGDAVVELAAAGGFWMADDHLLAGPRITRAMPHPFWRVWFSRRRPALQLPPSDGGALGADDAGGAGAIPATLSSGPLRVDAAPRSDAEYVMVRSDRFG